MTNSPANPKPRHTSVNFLATPASSDQVFSAVTRWKGVTSASASDRRSKACCWKYLKISKGVLSVPPKAGVDDNAGEAVRNERVPISSGARKRASEGMSASKQARERREQTSVRVSE